MVCFCVSLIGCIPALVLSRGANPVILELGNATCEPINDFVFIDILILPIKPAPAFIEKTSVHADVPSVCRYIFYLVKFPIHFILKVKP